MRIIVTALSIYSCEMVFLNFLGVPKCPLDVFFNLLCVLLAAFVSTIFCAAIFDSRGIESMSILPNTFFYYGFGTMILATGLPTLSVYLVEYKIVSFVGVAMILFATLLFNHTLAPKNRYSVSIR